MFPSGREASFSELIIFLFAFLVCVHSIRDFCVGDLAVCLSLLFVLSVVCLLCVLCLFVLDLLVGGGDILYFSSRR